MKIVETNKGLLAEKVTLHDLQDLLRGWVRSYSERPDVFVLGTFTLLNDSFRPFGSGYVNDLTTVLEVSGEGFVAIEHKGRKTWVVPVGETWQQVFLISPKRNQI